MNANLCGSICLYCISGHVWPLQPSSLTRGRPPQPPPPLAPPAKAPVEKGGQAVGWSGREVWGSSRIFCKIHYRAFASPTAPKNGIGRCTLTLFLKKFARRGRRPLLVTLSLVGRLHHSVAGHPPCATLCAYDRSLRSTCPPPATWGFRRNSGQRGSRGRCSGPTGRTYRGPPTGKARPR